MKDLVLYLSFTILIGTVLMVSPSSMSYRFRQSQPHHTRILQLPLRGEGTSCVPLGVNPSGAIEKSEITHTSVDLAIISVVGSDLVQSPSLDFICDRLHKVTDRVCPNRELPLFPNGQAKTCQIGHFSDTVDKYIEATSPWRKPMLDKDDDYDYISL